MQVPKLKVHFSNMFLQQESAMQVPQPHISTTVLNNVFLTVTKGTLKDGV